MNNRVQYINDMFKYLMQKNDTEEYNTFFSLLEMIKYNSHLLDYYGDEFVENIIHILPNIKNKYDKASLIETIVQCFYDYEFNKSYCKEIFDEYILCLAESTTSVKDTIICLKGFIHAGISQNEIFIKLAESLKKETAINILCQMGIENWTNVPSELSLFLNEVQKAYNIRYRSIIIGQFILLVNSKCRKYAGISEITLVYRSYNGIYEDCWPRGLLNSKDILIKSKIMSLREIEILEELDKELSSRIKLESLEVKKLYDDFFEGRYILDVIYTLPE